MTTRRELLVAAATLVPLALALKTAAAEEPPEDHKQEGHKEEGHKKEGHEAHGKADFLFVQNARAIGYADGRLTLKGVNPATILFSDRPERIAGHIATARFVPFWGEGKDSFLKDPPNATLSFLEDKELDDVVLVLEEPQLVGEELSYKVRVLEGQLPTAGGPASLFIDIIGMPLTPLSFAGARRRAWRRAVYY